MIPFLSIPYFRIYHFHLCQSILFSHLKLLFLLNKHKNFFFRYLINALNVENFPKHFTYIFVAIGYDISIMHVDEESVIAFNFIKNLKKWLNDNLEVTALLTKRKHPNEKILESEIPARYMGYSLPIIVAITIPEVCFIKSFQRNLF